MTRTERLHRAGRWLVVSIAIFTVLFTAVVATAGFQRAGDTQRVIEEIKDANETTLENQRNGFKTRALLCASLLLDGVDVEEVSPCNEAGIAEFFDAELIAEVRDGQLAQVCAVIADLGADPPPECERFRS